MTRERRPSLSPPPSELPRAEAFDEAEPTEEELREAAALREAMEHGGDPLASALQAAWAPPALDAGDLEAILERALGEGDAAPTRLERAAADALREEIARGQGFGEGSALLGDLKAAYRPGEIDPARNEALIERALAAAAPLPRLRVVRGGGGAAPREAARRARLAPATMTALAAVAALAASVALLVGKLDRADAPAAQVTLIHARSTDALFDPAQRFEVGQQSARVDRIASARASDLRNNRFAAWGVQ